MRSYCAQFAAGYEAGLLALKPRGAWRLFAFGATLYQVTLTTSRSTPSDRSVCSVCGSVAGLLSSALSWKLASWLVAADALATGSVRAKAIKRKIRLIRSITNSNTSNMQRLHRASMVFRVHYVTGGSSTSSRRARMSRPAAMGMSAAGGGHAPIDGRRPNGTINTDEGRDDGSWLAHAR